MQTQNSLVLFDKPMESNQLKELFADFAVKAEGIKKIADYAKGKDELMLYFFTGASSSSFYAERVFCEKTALKVLQAEYWQKVINMTDVLQSMPAEKRSELHEQIRTHKTPDFTPEIVFETINSLLMQRGKFFAQKVDGIFRNLSGEHVTNSPMAFKKRMILSRVTDEWHSANWQKCDIIDDFREVVARILGRDWKNDQRRTSNDINHIVKDKEAFGEWFEFDGGAFKMRCYKVGTAHLEVHPDVAIELNKILGELYPSVIPHTQKELLQSSLLKHQR